MVKKIKLKSREKLEKSDYVYHYYASSNKVVLTNKAGSYKIVDLSDLDNYFTIVDTKQLITLNQYEEFKDLFEEVE